MNLVLHANAKGAVMDADAVAAVSNAALLTGTYLAAAAGSGVVGNGSYDGVAGSSRIPVGLKHLCQKKCSPVSEKSTSVR